MNSAAIPHKVKLQINTSGSWRDVMRFKIYDVDTDLVQVSAANMVLHGDPSGKTTLRLCTDDGFARALIHWTREKGWVAV